MFFLNRVLQIRFLVPYNSNEKYAFCFAVCYIADVKNFHAAPKRQEKQKKRRKN